MDVCLTDPGHPVTLTVTAKLRTLVDVLMGDTKLAEALRRGLVVVQGDRDLARQLEMLFEFEGSESFAGQTRVRRLEGQLAETRSEVSSAAGRAPSALRT